MRYLLIFLVSFACSGGPISLSLNFLLFTSISLFSSCIGKHSCNTPCLSIFLGVWRRMTVCWSCRWGSRDLKYILIITGWLNNSGKLYIHVFSKWTSCFSKIIGTVQTLVSSWAVLMGGLFASDDGWAFPYFIDLYLNNPFLCVNA